MTVEHTERKLARVVKIDSLHEIKGADRIELAMIGGWQVVAQKGLYAAGDLAVYFEVDSLLPLDNPAFQFLSSSKNTVVDGVEYARIKTIKLRKQLSQGVLVPLTELGLKGFVFDDDLTKRLGILKYEKAAEKGMNGTPGVAGSKAFPSFIPKTDQTRLQNIPTQFEQARDKGELFEKSFKLDGSSLTAYSYKGVLGVASRNVGFNMQTVNKGFFTTLKEFVNMVKQRGFKRAKWEPQIKADKNAFTEMAQESGVLTALVRENRNLAFQGEMVGPSIQQNFEGVEKNELYIYDVYDIDARKYLLPADRQALCAKYGLKHVPLASPHPVVLPVDVATAILDADGDSGLNGKYREGFVYKSMDRDFSFKVISNAYLLKEE
jgi:RNA ligase (TIGR02306 family)